MAALLGNVALAAIFGLFAGSQVSAAIGTGQWATTMPIALQETLLVVLFLTRRRCFATSDRPLDWIVGVIGTVLPLLMRPDAVRGPLNWLGEPLQFLGVAAAVVALSFLGRSFGVVAANRGVKTSGLYQIVRHPTYAGYMLSYVGYVMCYPTSSNLLVAIATLFAFNARAIFEERLLRRDPTTEPTSSRRPGASSRTSTRPPRAPPSATARAARASPPAEEPGGDPSAAWRPVPPGS